MFPGMKSGFGDCLLTRSLNYQVVFGLFYWILRYPFLTAIWVRYVLGRELWFTLDAIILSGWVRVYTKSRIRLVSAPTRGGELWFWHFHIWNVYMLCMRDGSTWFLKFFMFLLFWIYANVNSFISEAEVWYSCLLRCVLSDF